MRLRSSTGAAPMKSHLLLSTLVLAAGALTLGGCALDASTDGPAAHSEPVYRTGSNIAIGRNAHGSSDVTTLNADQAERVLRAPITMPLPLPNKPGG